MPTTDPTFHRSRNPHGEKSIGIYRGNPQQNEVTGLPTKTCHHCGTLLHPSCCTQTSSPLCCNIMTSQFHSIQEAQWHSAKHCCLARMRFWVQPLSSLHGASSGYSGFLPQLKDMRLRDYAGRHSKLEFVLNGPFWLNKSLLLKITMHYYFFFKILFL